MVARQKLLVEDAVAGRGGHGDLLSVAHAQGAVDPGLLRASGVVDLVLDAASIRRPARRRRESTRDHRSELVGADDRRAVGRAGVEPDDPRPFPSKSGSFDLVHERVRRQRTPSASKIRRTWDRATSIPAPRASATRASRVHSGGPSSSAAARSPPADLTSRPGGGRLTRPMMTDRSASVIRRGRPLPGRSSSPSKPRALNRCSHHRTVFG